MQMQCGKQYMKCEGNKHGISNKQFISASVKLAFKKKVNNCCGSVILNQ